MVHRFAERSAHRPSQGRTSRERGSVGRHAEDPGNATLTVPTDKVPSRIWTRPPLIVPTNPLVLRVLPYGLVVPAILPYFLMPARLAHSRSPVAAVEIPRAIRMVRRSSHCRHRDLGQALDRERIGEMSSTVRSIAVAGTSPRRPWASSAIRTLRRRTPRGGPDAPKKDHPVQGLKEVSRLVPVFGERIWSSPDPTHLDRSLTAECRLRSEQPTTS